MKRTNLVLDEEILEEATRLSGEKTCSGAVMRALGAVGGRPRRDAGRPPHQEDVVILVDTSVWIDVFRVRRPLDLETSVDFDDVVTCLPIVQEVLQGFRDEDTYRRGCGSGNHASRQAGGKSPEARETSHD